MRREISSPGSLIIRQVGWFDGLVAKDVQLFGEVFRFADVAGEGVFLNGLDHLHGGFKAVWLLEFHLFDIEEIFEQLVRLGFMMDMNPGAAEEHPNS